MGFNFLSKMGYKALNIGRHMAGGVAKAGRFAQTISKTVGKAEHWFDGMLDRASTVPVIRQVAEFLRDNEVYKGIHGVVDDVRGVVESGAFNDALNGLERIDHEAHNLQNLIPMGAMKTGGVAAGIGSGGSAAPAAASAIASVAVM